jgi:hypothetical protein
LCWAAHRLGRLQANPHLGLVVSALRDPVFPQIFSHQVHVPHDRHHGHVPGVGWDGDYSRVDGAILFGTFIIYSFYLYVDERSIIKKKTTSLKAKDRQRHSPERQRCTA